MKKWTVILASILIFCACSQKNSERNFSEIQFEEGDLVFRKGIGAKSQAVMLADSVGIYSHSGIVVKDGESFKIIHITPGEREKGETADKIKMETSEIFWQKDRAKHGAVYRLKNNEWGEKAVREAQRLLAKNVLFDHDYNLNDTTEMYCTELVFYAYQLAGKDVSFGKRSVLENVPLYSGTYIFPSDIYKNKEFILIYKF